MTNNPPPPELDDAAGSGGVWQWYRSMPMGLQVLIPLVVVALVAGVVVWATGSSDDGGISSDTTVAGVTDVEKVLKGIIVVGGLGGSTDTTAVTASTETPVATTAATDAPTTTAPATPAPATTAAPENTDVPDRTVAPETTDAPVVTDAPETTDEAVTTEASVTTEAPATTEAPDDTEAPTTTEGPAPGLPTVADFVSQWNEASAGTDVPTITAAEATELTGQYAGNHLITLSAQIGLLGTLTAPGSGQLDQVVLVWIPGDDDGSELYWDSFRVLTQAVSPGTTAAETVGLERSLGRAPGMPPFTTTAAASSHGFDYQLFSEPYEGDDGTIEVSAISVT